MITDIDDFESKLDSFDKNTRFEALNELFKLAESGELTVSEPSSKFNLHCHTFYSYNGYGMSPVHVAWRAYKEGLYAAGIVDFDVLNGIDEFLEACDLLGMRSGCGIETRVFVPEFSDKVINSPGEPGIAYHMGSGFCSGTANNNDLLETLHNTAQNRNLNIIDRVNAFLNPLNLDYEKDVLELTPAGNATERHICMAYDNKARESYSTENLIKFWSEKLNTDVKLIKHIINDKPELQALIRSKTMKQGGVGYIKPEAGDFPDVSIVNQFTITNGGIPTLAWLDGMSEGEKDIESLLKLMIEKGVAAVNIIPDRNFNIKDQDLKTKKTEEFNKFIKLAISNDLPVLIGTEMNAYGQRFVDDFSAPEMQQHKETFLMGADILHAHTILQKYAEKGYLSSWSNEHFPNKKSRNIYYSAFGKLVNMLNNEQITALNSIESPEKLLAMFK